MKEIPEGLEKLGNVEVCAICGIPLERMKAKFPWFTESDFFVDYFIVNHLLSNHREEVKDKMYKEFVKTYRDYSHNPMFTGMRIVDSKDK